MIEIPPSDLPAALRAAFTMAEPAGLRCLGVLAGVLRGRVFVDDAAEPTRALLHETMYGTIYLSGAWTPAQVAEMIHDFRRRGEVMIGLWPDDPRIALLPTNTDYIGTVYDFYDHPSATVLASLSAKMPAHCELRPLESSVFDSLIERAMLLKHYGDVDAALSTIMGYCLFYEGQNVCEAVAGPLIDGIREMGILTHKDYRRRGYATLTCAALLQACGRLGVQTFWNCNSSNLASVALARRLGYQRERAYTLYYWEPRQQ